MKKAPYCSRGGLTLIPMPGFEAQALLVAQRIESYSRTKNHRYTPVDIVAPVFGHYVNDEPFLELGNEHIADHDCFILGSGPGSWEVLGQLNFLLRQVVGRRPGSLSLVLGYFPLGRSDRDKGRKIFAMPRFIVDQMVSAGSSRKVSLSRIIAVDLHAPQTVIAGEAGFITELTLVRRILRKAIDDALANGERICLAFPDDGSAKRTEDAIDAIERDLSMHIPVVCGKKRRLSSTEAELKQLFGDTPELRGATVLCVDDEIATGGTNVKAAHVIKETYGASRVYAVVTHAVLCKGAPTLFLDADCPVDRIYATNTIQTHNRLSLKPLIDAGKLVVFDWSTDLGDAILHDHWGGTIRELR